MVTKQFDAIIIGSGQGGTPLAIRLARKGYHTALIEKQHIGGSCINDGCIPSKTLIASAKATKEAAIAGTLGIENRENYTVNFDKIMARKKAIVERFRKGSTRSLEETPQLELYYGTAAFSGHKQVAVTDQEGFIYSLTAPLIVINTGTVATVPDIEGLRGSGYLTADTLMELDVLPEHLIVLGAGYISLEMGQAFRRFGSRVTLIESNSHLLEQEDEDIRDCLVSLLQAEGIDLLTGTDMQRVSRKKTGALSLTLQSDGGTSELKGSHLLVAAGRQPDTAALQLDRSGITADKEGYITVNDKLETNVPGIYALGDVKGGPAFTHVAYNDYRLLFRNLTEGTGCSIAGRQTVYCMFTDPELGRVGLTEQEAQLQGKDIMVARLPVERSARAIIEHRTEGLLKAIVDKESGLILGAAMLSYNGGELMSVLQMAMSAGFTYKQVRDQMFAHPTLTESLTNLFFTLE